MSSDESTAKIADYFDSEDPTAAIGEFIDELVGHLEVIGSSPEEIALIFATLGEVDLSDYFEGKKEEE